MIKMEEPRFAIGDTVVVVGTPYEACPFGWIDEMDEQCGRETTITRVNWYDEHQTYAYSISGDDGSCMWCENCFMSSEPDLTESDAELSVLLV